jgi:hypothetical protein
MRAIDVAIGLPAVTRDAMLARTRRPPAIEAEERA